ncbi:MAG: AAA family ATPase [Proteobacteria bacterium]|nr:AAA family ATPase [Pseudomonadota bacterium]
MEKLTTTQIKKTSTYSSKNGQIKKEGFFDIQKSAIEAIEFGLDIKSDGYNIFALGEPGLGKHHLILEITKQKALSEKEPEDFVYVYNFKEPDSPIYLNFPKGYGALFSKEMDELIESLRKEIPKVFESKEFEQERTQLIERFQEFDRQIFESLNDEARGRGFVLEKGAEGFMFLPVKDNEVLDDEKFSRLSEVEKKAIQEKIKVLQNRLKEAIKVVKEAEKETRRKLLELEKKVAFNNVAYHIDDLKERFGFNPKIIEYLSNVQEDILNNLEDFKQAELPVPANMALRFFKPEPSFVKYKVNVLIDRSGEEGTPVVFETNPNAFNLIGKIEYRFQMGMALTDFTLIKSGALHKANGGYLILDALDVFKNPFSYDILKRAIKNKEIRIEDPMEPYRMSSGTLKPEPIPLDIKITIIGNPFIYYILYNYDEEFSKIFKVKVDFERDILWDEKGESSYAFYINHLVEKEGLLPFDDSAIQRVIEYGGRLIDDQKRLSIRIDDIAELVREACFFAKKSGKDIVTREDVVTALNKKRERHNKIERKIQEQFMRDVLLVSTEGSRVGVINGLSVYDLGDYRFGRPSRITATVSTGKGGVVHIDREAKLSGKIHDKASMIISSYFNNKFGKKGSLSFSANICFEQLYGMIEGDSASVAEAVVLHSAIGNIPIKQCISVTGSINQYGEVQPIGGVNEKIEGFFEVVKERGFKEKETGVIIPKSNVQHLMLNEEVCSAVEKGLFHIYAVENVEEALELLTGLKSGAYDPQTGRFEENSVNYYVEKALLELKEKGKEEGKKPKEKKKDE